MRRHVILAAALGGVLVAGCGKSDPRGERMAVRGAVLIDGEPLKRARVVFEAAEGETKVRSTASVVDGFFEIPAERGPLAGKHLIRIEPEQLDLGEFELAKQKNPAATINPNVVDIPARYNEQSEIEVTVSNNPMANKFDFEIESKPKN